MGATLRIKACLGWVPPLAFLALLMGDRVGIEIEDFISKGCHVPHWTIVIWVKSPRRGD